MGREIRKVPKGWEHPRDERGHFQPLHDRTFKEVAEEWWSSAVAWHKGDVSEIDEKYRKKYPWYWQFNGDPPTSIYYRDEFTAPADCFQIYENVSEGTPVSPVFDSIDDMIAWMTQPIDRSSPYNVGKDWQTMQGMTIEQAKKFCQDGSSPSLIFTPETGIKAGHRDEGP